MLNRSFNINFLKHQKLLLGLSAFISLACLVLIFAKGINLTVEFTGGVSADISYSGSFEDLENLIGGKFDKGFEMRDLGDNTASIKLKGDNEDWVKNELASLPIRIMSIESITPQIGKELAWRSFLALVFTILVIMVYLALRLEWQFGVGVSVALIHDAILIFGFVSLFGIEFGISSVAAVLTVLGYSVNDSVIIYERIKENIHQRKNISLYELINQSLNEIFTRTIMTVSTVLLATLVIIVMMPPIRSFALITFAGVIIGTYSSIAVSAGILLYIKPSRFKPVK